MKIKFLFHSFKKSIRVKLLTYFLIVSILPILLLGFIPYYKSQEIVENQMLNLAKSVVSQLNSNITYYFKEMDLMSNIIYYQLREKGDFLLIDEFGPFLQELKNNRSFIANIHVITDKQVLSTAGVIEREKLEMEDWYLEALNRIDEKTWIEPHFTRYLVKSTEGRAVSLMYPFLHEGKLRVILIEMYQNELDRLFARPDLKKMGTLIIIDKYGKVIYSTDHTVIDGYSNQYIGYITLFDHVNKKYRFIDDANVLSGWKLAALISEDQINKSFYTIRKIVFVLLGVFLYYLLFLH